MQDQDTFHKKNLYIFIFFIVILGSLNLTVSAQTVNFPDAKLAAAIRTTLGLAEGADIPQTDLETMTQLDVEDKGITDLTGLEHATGLTSLILSDNSIDDFSPLSSLINLSTRLHLANTTFSSADFDVLLPLVNLVGLRLDGNEITTLTKLATALSKMDNLEGLLLSVNQISDLSPLSSVKT